MFKDYFNELCKKHGYIGSMGYDKNTDEYHIVISKGDDNAGAFMTKEELKEMNNIQIQNLLEMLHTGFVHKFKK